MFHNSKQYFRPRWLTLLGLISVLLIMPNQSGLAQEPTQENQVFLPLFNASIPALNATETGQESSDGHIDHEHVGIGHIPHNGRFTTNNGQVNSWPPQVKYIDDVVWHTAAAEVHASQVTIEESIAQTALQDENVLDRLGERYTFIDTAPIREKWQEGNSGHKVTFFSYSNNITIEVIVQDGIIASIDTFAPADYQPPLRQNEVEEAADIARQYWLDQGNNRVNELRGFTIQTFVTEGEGGYYNSRMTYVSFHVDEISVPELLTWVDLTTQTVVRAAVDVEGVQYEQ